MTLGRTRWVVRYYLWLVEAATDRWTAEQRLKDGTNLCSFVWRIFFGTAVLVAMTALVGGFIALVVKVAITDPMHLVFGLGIAVGLVAIAAILTVLVCGVRSAARSDSIVLTYIKSAKQGVCPLVKFTEPQ